MESWQYRKRISLKTHCIGSNIKFAFTNIVLKKKREEKMSAEAPMRWFHSPNACCNWVWAVDAVRPLLLHGQQRFKYLSLLPPRVNIRKKLKSGADPGLDLATLLPLKESRPKYLVPATHGG